MQPTGKLAETAPTHIAGSRAIGIRGDGPAVSPGGPPSAITLFVSDSARPLPLQAVITAAVGSGTITLSRWGEHLALRAPRDVVPIREFAP
jgi:hypothetical protein